MPGNINFSKFWAIVGILVPPPNYGGETFEVSSMNIVGHSLTF